MDCRDTETLSKQETDDPDIGHKPRWSFLSVSASLRLIGLSVALATVGCGVPNLEKPQCTAARESVKHFYSVHVGNDMRPSNEYLKVREPFLTSELLKKYIGDN